MHRSIKVSIIMPCYNSSRFVIQAINSVIGQSHINWELLITDDCSTDGCVALIEKTFHDEDRINIVVNKKNRGAAVSRNKSIERVTGDYIAFLDSDDLWKENKLSEQLNFMITNNYNFCYTAFELIGEDGTSFNKVIDLNNVPSVTYACMLKKKPP